MRAHRGRPGPTVLLAGDSGDLRDLRALASALPVDAYGQVYVEVAPGEPLEHLEAPARVTVTRLERTGDDRRRGALLTAAVEAWIAEWMPAGARDDRRIAWIGCACAPALAERYRALQEHSLSAAAMGLPSVDEA
ncbi:SIP domain-containing protein [Amnibacterium kyonggiense]